MSDLYYNSDDGIHYTIYHLELCLPFPRNLVLSQLALSGYVSCHVLATGCEQSV